MQRRRNADAELISKRLTLNVFTVVVLQNAANYQNILISCLLKV